MMYIISSKGHAKETIATKLPPMNTARTLQKKLQIIQKVLLEKKVQKNLPGLPLSKVSCPICFDKTLKSGFVNFTIKLYISGKMSKIAPELDKTSKQATTGNVLWKLFSSSTVNIGTASYSWFELFCYVID